MEEAAKALRITSQDLLDLKIIDGTIPEPMGGAHRDAEQTALNIKQAVTKHLRELKDLTPAELIQKRYKKYRGIGEFKRG